MISSAERVLPLLHQVRPCGADSWRALCPAHDDHFPSLSIRHTDDRLLLHCWAGCQVDEVVQALGITVSHLFDTHSSRPDPVLDRRRWAEFGFHQWREQKLCAIAQELRERDFWIWSIDVAVERGEMSEDEAWTYFGCLYRGYSESEHRFDILRRGTDEQALEVYRDEQTTES